MCKQAVSPHSYAEGDLVYRQTVRHGTDCYHNKAFSSSPYLHVESTFPWTTLEAQVSLGTGTADHLGPGPVAGAGGLRHRRTAAPGLRGAAGSCGGSWGSAGRWGWSCWMESSVWWNLNRAVKTERGERENHCGGELSGPGSPCRLLPSYGDTPSKACHVVPAGEIANQGPPPP